MIIEIYFKAIWNVLSIPGGTNKDLGKFADQIIALCDKWER